MSKYILLTVGLRTTKFMLFFGPKCKLNNLPNQNTMRHRQPYRIKNILQKNRPI